MRYRSIVIPLVIVFAVALGALPALAQNSLPRAVVERFHETLLGVMKEADKLGVKGRYKRLAPVIDSSFDLRLSIRVATGSYWRKATDAQKEKLVEAFRRMSISDYASSFDGYSGESFETVRVRPGPQGTMLVRTKIVSPDKKPVGLTYVLKASDDQWRIVDVLLDNDVSQLAVRRSEYRRVLKRKGVDGLVATLNRKADQLLAE